MSAWLPVGVATAVVIVMRCLFVVGGDRIRVPPWIERTSPHLAPAVTAALLAPHFLTHASRSPAALVALAIAAPVALWTRSVGWTLGCGMAVAWVGAAAGAVA